MKLYAVMSSEIAKGVRYDNLLGVFSSKDLAQEAAYKKSLPIGKWLELRQGVKSRAYILEVNLNTTRW